MQHPCYCKNLASQRTRIYHAPPEKGRSKISKHFVLTINNIAVYRASNYTQTSPTIIQPVLPSQHELIHQHAPSKVGCSAHVLSFSLKCGWSRAGQEMAGQQGRAVALMSSSVHSHQPRDGFLLHPGSLLRGNPFKTIMCQQSSPLSLFLCIYKVIIRSTFCVSFLQPYSGLSHPSHDLLYHRFPTPIFPVIQSFCSEFGFPWFPWGVDPEYDMLNSYQNDRK